MPASDYNHGQNTMADAAVGGNRVFVGTLRKAESEYFISVRDGNVFLAVCNPQDEQEESCKFTRIDTPIQDKEGERAFIIVNKANDLAVLNTFGPSHSMVLVPFNQAYLCKSLMWTEAGDGFGQIRALNSIQLNDGATVVLSEWPNGDFQSWKILPWGKLGDVTVGFPGPTFRIVCKAGEGFSATVRNGTVVLEPTNPRDECQHWFKDTRHGTGVMDEEGYPAFALLNKFTGKAIKVASQGEGYPLEVMNYKYIPNHLDESVLWTQGRDIGDGFACIRMATNIRHKFGALNGKMKKGKTTKHSQWLYHPVSDHYCPSCLQKRVCMLLTLRHELELVTETKK